jgi:hypothetical protein
MVNPLSSAALDLGLGEPGTALSQQVKDEDEERRKKLLRLAGQGQIGANAMGLAASQLLGAYGS